MRYFPFCLALTLSGCRLEPSAIAFGVDESMMDTALDVVTQKQQANSVWLVNLTAQVSEIEDEVGVISSCLEVSTSCPSLVETDTDE
jgi:hypothetical protein